jgi:uncharacterized OB-fold protein
MTHRVVQTWRLRATSSGRNGFRCAACGAVALVHRRACACCGHRAAAELVPLPPRAIARACSEVGLELEELDLLRRRRPAVFLELGTRLMACLVSDADADYASELKGTELRLVLRRRELDAQSESGPVLYTVKAAADVRERTRLLKQREATHVDGRKT